MITEKVLKALSEGRRVEYLGVNKNWYPLQRVGDKFHYLFHEKEPLAPNAASLLHSFVSLEWRISIEQRDWMGALEWIKEGKHVKRAGKKGSYARYSIEKPGQVVTFFMDLEDYQAKDWVVAND